MKKVLLFTLTLLIISGARAQFTFNDSLLGFDLPKTVIEAHYLNLEGEELKIYVNRAKKDFLKEKYQITETVIPQTFVSKLGSNTTASLPCFNEDFEGYSPGTMIANNGWTADQNVGNSYVCTSTSLIPMTTNTSAVVIYSTPITDPNFGTVGTSPFGGSKVVKINNTGNQVGRIRQNIPVTSSNWLYSYAYKGVLSDGVHGCCSDAFLMFRFYDPAGNYLSSMSHTVVMGTPSCVSTSTANWAPITSSVGLNYTPNWEIFAQNLSAYIGTVVTVEVIAGACIYSIHQGYMYYDGKCSSGAIIANGDTYLPPSTNFTSCPLTATLSGLPGFSGYQWQGPPASGVSGFTNSTITTSVSGTYTLSSSFGTVTATQTLNLLINPTNLSIVGSNTVCNGDSLILQASGAAISSYSWSNGSTLQAVSVSPSVATVYSLSVTNTLGCQSSASQTILVSTIPVMSVLSNTPSICIGQSVNLIAGAAGTPSYTWNTGATGPNTTVNPSVTTIYTVTGTTSGGCYTSGTKTIVVFPLPQFQLGQSSTSLCFGQSASLFATGASGNSYHWSTGVTASSISVSPSITSVYSVVAVSNAGCSASDSKTITVYPLPQIQVVTSNTEICVGQAANLGVLGSNIATAQWNTGANALSISVSPTLNSVYSITVTSSFGCLANQTVSILVNPLPQAQIISSSQSICIGSTATLSANGQGLVTYLWNGGQLSPSIVVSPSVTSNYSVIVTDSKGCSSNTNFQLEVAPCTTTFVGIGESSLSPGKFIVFPNPSGGAFEIKGFKPEKGWLINDLGQMISEFYLGPDNNYTFKITNLAKGIYFVTSNAGTEKVIVK